MQSAKKRRLGKADAERIAIGVLGFLAGDAGHLARFLALTGIEPQALRAEAENGQFLVSLLDYLMADETLLLAFCANEGVDPEQIAPARHLLVGEEG